MNLDKKQLQTVILITLVSLIVFLAYLYLLLMPQISRVIETCGRLVKTKSALADTGGEAAKISELKREIGMRQDKMTRYEKMFPPDQPISGLLENLSTMARNSNVKITAITPETARAPSAQKDKVYQTISIRINAKSGYHELGNFLARLEGSDKFMKVGDIDIRAAAGSPKKHDVELLIFTYKLIKK